MPLPCALWANGSGILNFEMLWVSGPNRYPARMQHDVFICHASKDKDDLVRSLATELQAQDLDVWYDEFSLTVGDSLRQSIDRGLAESKFGIIVLSKAFFKKPWTQWELNGPTAKMMHEGRKLVLPIWHGVGPGDAVKYSPPLADILALSSTLGTTKLCTELLKTQPYRKSTSCRPRGVTPL